MIYNYYPGCTLSTKAKQLDMAARRCAEVLGFPLVELPEWQCCGAVYPMAPDAIAERLSAVRALVAARENGGVLVTLCSACYHVIKRVNHDMATNAEIRQKVNNYLQLEEPYAGETRVLHYLEVLRDEIGWEKLAQLVSHPLKERRVGAYYGCLLLRPGAVLALDDVESPTVMEAFIKALGAEPVIYSMRNECCGGYLALKDKAQCEQLVSKIKNNAVSCGAQELVTACPLCAYNLTANGAAGSLPTRYFTELLAEALGVAESEGGAE